MFFSIDKKTKKIIPIEVAEHGVKYHCPYCNMNDFPEADVVLVASNDKELFFRRINKEKHSANCQATFQTNYSPDFRKTNFVDLIMGLLNDDSKREPSVGTRDEDDDISKTTGSSDPKSGAFRSLKDVARFEFRNFVRPNDFIGMNGQKVADYVVPSYYIWGNYFWGNSNLSKETLSEKAGKFIIEFTSVCFDEQGNKKCTCEAKYWRGKNLQLILFTLIFENREDFKSFKNEWNKNKKLVIKKNDTTGSEFTSMASVLVAADWSFNASTDKFVGKIRNKKQFYVLSREFPNKKNAK